MPCLTPMAVSGQLLFRPTCTNAVPTGLRRNHHSCSQAAELSLHRQSSAFAENKHSSEDGRRVSGLHAGLGPPPYTASTPSISSKISASSKRFWPIEPEGQEATQVPQPLHSTSLMAAFFTSSFQPMAL